MLMRPTRKDSRPVVAKLPKGLLYWATRAHAGLAKAADGLQPDPVHDLRVAIRRCRSMAEGLRSVDPAPGWKQFRSLPKPLFAALGELRDTQVLQEWLTSLAPERDPVRIALSSKLSARQAEQKRVASEALNSFTAKRWLRLAKELDVRARRIRLGSAVFRHLALERWMEAHRLHETAARTLSDFDLHQLRIGIKRLRYTVENFLPDLHRRWGKDLKRMQDLLGEVHDLDVLTAELKETPTVRNQFDGFSARIRQAREQRVSEYLSHTSGPDSLWDVWRAGLPSGRELPAAAGAMLRHWSRALDRNPAHSQHVARTAIQLWHGLRRALRWPFDRRATVLLRHAALLHGLGEHKRPEKAQSYRTRMLGKLAAPVGWTEEEIAIVRLAARFSSGPLPSTADPALSTLPDVQQRAVLRMAGVLRLADALNSTPAEAMITGIGGDQGCITAHVAGFDPVGESALAVGAARHLLELSEGVPILVRPAAPNTAAAAATDSFQG